MAAKCQKHITGVYRGEFDSSKLELIQQLKSQVEEQSSHANKIKTWIRDSLKLKQERNFLHRYLSFFKSKSLDPTIFYLARTLDLSSRRLANTRTNSARSKSRLTIGLSNKMAQNYQAISNIQDEIGFSMNLLVDMNSLLDHYLKLKRKHTHSFPINYVCVHKIIYYNIHRFEPSLAALFSILTSAVAHYNALKDKYIRRYKTDCHLFNFFKHNLYYYYSTRMLSKDLNDLKTKADLIFSTLKSKFPSYFSSPHAYSEFNPGYESEYTDPTAESDTAAEHNQNPACSLYQALEFVEYVPSFD